MGLLLGTTFVFAPGADRRSVNLNAHGFWDSWLYEAGFVLADAGKRPLTSNGGLSIGPKGALPTFGGPEMRFVGRRVTASLRVMPAPMKNGTACAAQRVASLSFFEPGKLCDTFPAACAQVGRASIPL